MKSPCPSGSSSTADPAVELAARTECLWAKSSQFGGLPLVRHLLDVGAVAYELTATLPGQVLERRARQLGLGIADAHAWLAVLVGCHDLGKATPCFQDKWPEGRKVAQGAGFTFPLGTPDRHDAGTAHLLRGSLKALGVSVADAGLLTDAVAAHHGFSAPSTDRAAHGRFTLDTLWVESQRWLFEQVLRTIGAHGTPRLDAEPSSRADLFHWLAGLCSTADWIGSSDRFFPHDRPRLSLDDWYARGRQQARQAIRTCGLASSGVPPIPSAAAALEAALPPGMQARPLQQSITEALEPLPDGPVLVLVEAPMGEGKTEAAFAVDAWLRSRGTSRGLYVAMPTQATSNALFARVARYLSRLGLPGPVELHVAHGGASIEHTTLRLREVGMGGEDAAVAASAWLAGGKRVLLAENAVGTVDQALIAVLNAKHHFVRHFGLADRHVVLDEVHAYDTYTGGLIQQSVAWLRAAGSSVVLLSATLPRQRAKALVGEFAADEAPEVPYPRITIVAGGRTQRLHIPASRTYSVAVEPFSADADAVASHAMEMATAGACVLVVVNKVARAQELYRIIAQSVPRVMLFHARFPMEKRLEIEQAVLARFGPDGTDRRGSILVATQVAEQSLDVDFDVLITDLAPVDLVLQRIGRVHRHPRQRPPGFERARVYVSGLGASPDHLPTLSLSSRIYDDLPVLRTAYWLRSRTELNLPSHIDQGVQWVYGDEVVQDAAPAFVQACAKASVDFAEKQTHQAALATKAALPKPAEWSGPAESAPLDDEAASNGLSRFGTRLGERSISCVPVYRWPGGFSVRGDLLDWAEDHAVPEAAAVQLGRRYLRISQFHLLQHLERVQAPEGWDKHPSLRGHVPLVLDAEGRLQIGSLSVTLDPALGLVVKQTPRGEDNHA